MIFETERLFTRKLKHDDLQGFYELESNPEVLKYADGNVKNFKECEEDLNNLITKYTLKQNDFWIYAIVRKSDLQFFGTVALVKANATYEIGFRFLEKYWGFGYGSEICNGLVDYCTSLKMKEIFAFVDTNNTASLKILKKHNFKKVNSFIDTNNPYEMKLKRYL